MANSKFRRVLAYDKSFKRTDVRIGDATLLYKVINRKCAPRRRDPANISDTDETGATAKFHLQTFKVARSYVREKAKAKYVEDMESDPLQTRTGSAEAAPWVDSALRN